MRGTRAPPILPIYAHLPSVLNSTTAAGQCHRHACPTAIGARRYHHDHHGLIEKYKDNPTKHWDKFYKRHQSKFFKDRHYLEKDWGQCFADDVNENGKVVLEVGCGAGNTIFPLLAAYPKIYVHACDFSPHAISLVKSHVDFREDRVNAFICDVTDINLCETISPSSVDVVTLIFMLFAVSPEKMSLILGNIRRVLKPCGYVLMRDYAIGDFAQVKLQEKNRMISPDFYARGDGTCSFYFSEDFLSTLFVRAGFSIVDISIYCKQIKNRSRNITMDRRWIRAIFKNIDCTIPDSAQVAEAG